MASARGSVESALKLDANQTLIQSGAMADKLPYLEGALRAASYGITALALGLLVARVG